MHVYTPTSPVVLWKIKSKQLKLYIDPSPLPNTYASNMHTDIYIGDTYIKLISLYLGPTTTHIQIEIYPSFCFPHAHTKKPRRKKEKSRSNS